MKFLNFYLVPFFGLAVGNVISLYYMNQDKELFLYGTFMQFVTVLLLYIVHRRAKINLKDS